MSRRKMVAGSQALVLMCVAWLATAARAQTAEEPPPAGDPAPPVEVPPPPSEAPAAAPATTEPEMTTPQEPVTETSETDKPTAEPEKGPRLQIYGHAMLDNIYEFLQSDPLWFDTARPTKLPSVPDQFGDNGHYWVSVRQSRFGAKAFLPTTPFLGELKTIFEFELFGTGAEAGETMFRIRHAWGELWQFGAGQTWSVFMDPDVFPNSLEYWGPSGIIFYRNAQLRWTPISNDFFEAAISAERPGGSADRDNSPTQAQPIDLTNVVARLPLPDFAAHLRLKGPWGHVQAAGIIRYLSWDDLDRDDGDDLSGSAVGWGVNLSSNIKFWKDTLRLQVAGGSGIQNYFNDAGADIGVEDNPGDADRPLLGKTLPVLGVVAFLDHTWFVDQVTSSIGYSYVGILNSDAQTPEAFQSGQYALANVLIHPVPSFFFGPEFQWVWRRNKSNDFIANDFRIQFSFKYMFDFEFGDEKK